MWLLLAIPDNSKLFSISLEGSSYRESTVQTLLPRFFFEVIFTTYHRQTLRYKKTPSFYNGVFVLERFNFVHGLGFIFPLLFGLIISLMNGKIIP